MLSSQQQYRLYFLLAFVLWSCKTTQPLPDKNKTTTKNNTSPVNVVFDELEETDVKEEEVSVAEPTLSKDELELKTKYAELLEASPKEIELIELYAFITRLFIVAISLIKSSCSFFVIGLVIFPNILVILS